MFLEPKPGFFITVYGAVFGGRLFVKQICNARGEQKPKAMVWPGLWFRIRSRSCLVFFGLVYPEYGCISGFDLCDKKFSV